MRKQFFSIILAGFLGGCVSYGSPPGHGGIPPGHGGIPPGQAKKMGPPALVIVSYPQLVVIPGTAIAVVQGVDADLFVIKGIYYYHHDHVWYTGTHHRGPWREIGAKDLPSGLRDKSPKELKSMANGKSKGGHGKGGK